MSDLAVQIDRYLAELVRGGNSSHTVDAYSADLREFLHYLSPPQTEPPAPSALDLLTLREWLASLYSHPVSYTHLDVYKRQLREK